MSPVATGQSTTATGTTESLTDGVVGQYECECIRWCVCHCYLASETRPPPPTTKPTTAAT